MSHRPPADPPMVPRCGVDPLDSPATIARVARAVLSPHEVRAIILVDDQLVGHLVIATDDDVVSYLPVIAHANTGITRIIIAERFSARSSAVPIERLGRLASWWGLHIVDLVVFDDRRSWSQLAVADRRTAADSRSPEFRR